MNHEELSQLTNDELLAEAKKMKSFSISNALFIGFLAGIIIYSIAVNRIGWFTLIPLFLIYKLVNDQKNKQYKELQALVKERGLK
jgi:hypothetical protein